MKMKNFHDELSGSLDEHFHKSVKDSLCNHLKHL